MRVGIPDDIWAVTDQPTFNCTYQPSVVSAEKLFLSFIFKQIFNKQYFQGLLCNNN